MRVNYMIIIAIAALLTLSSFTAKGDEEEPVIILRPSADNYTYWNEYPTSPATNYDKLDETTEGGDAYTTYIWTQQYSVTLASLEIDDAPIANDTGYSITVWVVALRQGASALQRISIAVYCNGAGTSSGQLSLTNSFANYTFTVNENPDTGEAWTPENLNETRITLAGYYASYPSNAIIATQIGVCVYDTGGGEEPPGEEEPFEWDVSIIGLMGFSGFCGMIAVPAVAAYLFKRDPGGVGSGVTTVVSALAAWMLCFGMFLGALN